MKESRHKKIIELISENSIGKQEELLSELQHAGFNVTQATVSRDIRELHLVKTATGNGGYRYVSSFDRTKSQHPQSRFEMIFRESAISANAAGNIVMVKCYAGMANAACEVFDSQVWSDMVGTLSGDDTFIILMSSEAAAIELCTQLKEFIPNN